MNFARDFSIAKTMGGNYASNAHKSAVLDAVRKTYSGNLSLTRMEAGTSLRFRRRLTPENENLSLKLGIEQWRGERNPTNQSEYVWYIARYIQ